jgi:predicted amidophosphoribosyltransferase
MTTKTESNEQVVYRCKWCGVEVEPKHQICDKCKDLHKQYKKYCARISKHSSVEYLCEFRNLLFDMLYNMPGAEDLPYDIQYQYERVNRYLSLKHNNG